MKKIQISVYLIVPLIMGMFSFFSFIVTYRVIEYASTRRISADLLLLTPAVALPLLSIIAGYFIIKKILEPSERLIEKAKNHPAVCSESNLKENIRNMDKLDEISTIFEQVGEALDLSTAESLFPNIIGKSKIMRGVLSHITKVARSDATVFILGESGTGKELVADSIVKIGTRKNNPFIKINCGAISSNLIESELFGHEKGAFTGASIMKKGCFELADQGSLFLDEIGDMPLELQVKLLRALQEKEFYRVGGKEPVKVDVRIIAATNKNPKTLVKEGKLREDLYYRLNVFPVNLPPLRMRKEDIGPLAEFFIDCNRLGKCITHKAIKKLEEYSWPGNVRELKNVVERANIISNDQKTILPEHLPTAIYDSLKSEDSLGFDRDCKNLDQRMAEIEINFICTSLKMNNGIQARAAEDLGIKQRSLWNRVKKYNIDAGRYKNKPDYRNAV
ncbi:MAG: sigma-54-dependent Fis family transcriptional regulator [Desulfobacter sp.]|nr:MAG: sigma-54-dependent Fis family transcriptional regulator [Desulfobacter sp.]